MSIDVVRYDPKRQPWDEEEVIAGNIKPRAGGPPPGRFRELPSGNLVPLPWQPEWVELVLPYKHGKGTVLHIRMHPGSFQDLAEAMMKVDSNAATRAFCAALQAGLPLPDAKSEAA
jgi:hypothetical protein